MLDTMSRKIKEQGEFEEKIEPFKSVEEIVENASGGLALKGINLLHGYFPKTSIFPVLERPLRVKSWNAQSPYETGFRQFSEANAAARFTKEVESSGFTHADGIAVSTGTVSVGVGVSFGSQTSHETENATKSNSTSVSATNFCRSVMKTFAIPRKYMQISEQASQKALSIMDQSKDEEEQKREILRFFEIFGSHVPCGVHQLGGVFFTTSIATSLDEIETSKLMHLNSNKLSTQVSVGYSALGVTDKHEQKSSKGSNEAKQDEEEKVSYTFSVKSIGPHADNPGSFKKALSENNATWAVLDRGDTSLIVPVWELLQEYDGEKFKVVASLMHKTFTEPIEFNKMHKEMFKVKLKAEVAEQMQKYRKKMVSVLPET